MKSVVLIIFSMLPGIVLANTSFCPKSLLKLVQADSSRSNKSYVFTIDEVEAKKSTAFRFIESFPQTSKKLGLEIKKVKLQQEGDPWGNNYFAKYEIKLPFFEGQIFDDLLELYNPISEHEIIDFIFAFHFMPKQVADAFLFMRETKKRLLQDFDLKEGQYIFSKLFVLEKRNSKFLNPFIIAFDYHDKKLKRFITLFTSMLIDPNLDKLGASLRDGVFEPETHTIKLLLNDFRKNSEKHDISPVVIDYLADRNDEFVKLFSKYFGENINWNLGHRIISKIHFEEERVRKDKDVPANVDELLRKARISDQLVKQYLTP